MQQVLTAMDGAAEDRFGTAVSISVDTVLVGSPLAKIGSKAQQGAAYIYVRAGGTWSLQQKLTAADGASFDNLGSRLALDADTAVVGALAASVGGNQQQGAAYVFTRSGATWTQQQKLVAADGSSFSNFGNGVALQADTTVIGAPASTVGANLAQGAAYVFVRNGITWTQQQKLIAPNGAANEYLGSALTLSGDTLAIGSPSAAINSNQNQGAVYVFVRSGTTWGQPQKLFAADGAAVQRFGSAVALDNDTLAVSVPGVQVSPLDQGAVYVLKRNGVNWDEAQRMATADGYGFGSSALATSGGSLLVGSAADNFSQGAAYAFVCSACPPITVSPATLPSNLTLNNPYNQAFTAAGGAAAYSFSVKTGTLPPGLSLSSGGALSGTPTSTGYFLFTVQATDASGCTGVRAYALNVIPSCGAITITPTTLSLGFVGSQYSAGISAGGGTGGGFHNYTFSITAGSLPPGLVLNPGPSVSSFIGGFPTTTGTYNFIVKAADEFGCSGTRAYTITVYPPCPDIQINPSTIPRARVGLPYSQSLAQTGGAPPVTWSISGDGLPAGITFNPITAVISGTPTSTITSLQIYNLTVRATDNNFCTGGQNYQLILLPPCTSITVTPATLPNGFVGTQFIQQLAASGGVADYSYTVSAGALPNGLSLSATGRLTGVPTAAGIFNFTVQATDNSACMGTRSYTLNINADPGPPWPPKLVASDGADSDQLGASVALSGNTAICGAPLDDFGQNIDAGAAYVFVRNGSSWSQQQKLVASDATSQEYFGTSVAISGDTAVVGSYKADISGKIDQGAAYVFVRSGTTWTLQQKLFDIDQGAANDNFGKSVAISGDTIVIGAPGVLGFSSGSGAAYIFVRTGTTWTKQQRIVGTNISGVVNRGLGNVVALDGGTLVIGASASNVGANDGQGAVFVFVLIGGLWTQQQILTASDGARSDFFGESAAVSGDTILIGASLQTVNQHFSQGSAYVYAKSGSTWTQQQKLFISDGAAFDTFGRSVGISGDVALIGANGTNNSSGAVYVYLRSGSLWIRQQTLTAYDAPPFANFGNAVAFSGDLSVIGAMTAIGTNVQSGAAYVYVPNCPAITVGPLTLAGGFVGEVYNQSLSAIGGTAPYSFHLTSGTLPAGLTLSPSGSLSGIPSLSGIFQITITASDVNGCQGTRAYTLFVNPAGCGALMISPQTLPKGVYNQTYPAVTLNASGGTALYTFSIVNGALPAGMSMLNGTLSGTPTASGNFDFTVRVTDLNGCFAEQSYSLIIAAYPALVFYPLPRPVRILDTRANQGNCDNVSIPIAGGASITTLARLTCEGITIPDTALAITGNVTVLNQTSQIGYMTIYPDGQPAPVAANMIYGGGAILSNNFTVGLSPDGKFDIFGERTIHVVVDISGYYAPPSSGGLYYHPLPKPVRLLDTRAGQGNCDNVATPIQAGASITTLARITCEGITIPQAAQAIVGNATVINGSGQLGYLTIYPNGVSVPLAANLIYFPGQILSNAFTVSLDADGKFNIFGEKTIDMVTDIAGYYSNEAVDVNGAGLLLTPLARPLRILDTRAGQGNCDAVSSPIAGGNSIAAAGQVTCEGMTIPLSARAILGNLTVINQTGQIGYLTAWPDGVAQPLAANLIYQPSQILSNAFVVGLNLGTGQYRLFAERTLDTVVDASAYFEP